MRDSRGFKRGMFSSGLASNLSTSLLLAPRTISGVFFYAHSEYLCGVSFRGIWVSKEKINSTEGPSFPKELRRRHAGREKNRLFVFHHFCCVFVVFVVFFPKQLQLMGFSILAKKQTLFQHDFQIDLPLSPFVSLLLDPVPT